MTELFDYAVERSDEFRQVDRAVELLADFVEVWHRDYNDDTGSLGGDDWSALVSIVNDFAVDLDMALVEYVMSAAVDRGAL